MKAAAGLAQLGADEYRLEEFHPGAASPFQTLLQFLGQASAPQPLLNSLAGVVQRLGRAPELRSTLGWLNDPRGAYARCFCTVELGGRRR